ncbi:alpha/beta hydrolase [Enterobacterales bacterium BD_CKDN230030183-1A_HGKHYDSX7]
MRERGMALNPEIAAFLELAQAGRSQGKVQAMADLSPEQARSEFELTSQRLDLGPEPVHRVQALTIPGPGGPLAARLYRDVVDDAALPVLLYFHGGGYVVGSLDSHDSLCRALAQQARCAVLAVAYRLAPEQRFPGACEDALQALQWLLGNAAELALDPSRVALGGDSVGGSLATVLANQLAANPDLADVQPRLQVLIYPVTDATDQGDSMQRFAEGYLLEARTLEWFYQHYQRQPEDRLDPRFSPLLGTVPGTAAPMLMLVGDHDPLYDQALAYADKARSSGVRVRCEVYEGMTHDFVRMGALVDEAEQAQALIAEVLLEVFG